MGLWTNLHIYQVENAELKIADLNKVLMSQAHGTFDELYSDECAGEPGWEGPFRTNAAGELEIANRSDGGFEGYDQYTSVWGCYDDVVFQAIADHLTAGKLVFFIECEEPSYNAYYVCTPGSFKEMKASAFAPTF